MHFHSREFLFVAPADFGVPGGGAGGLEAAQLEDKCGESCVGIRNGVVGLDVLQELRVDEFELQVGQAFREVISGRGHAVAVDLAEDDGVAFGDAGIDVGQLGDEVAQGGFAGVAFVEVQREGGGV